MRLVIELNTTWKVMLKSGFEQCKACVDIVLLKCDLSMGASTTRTQKNMHKWPARLARALLRAPMLWPQYDTPLPRPVSVQGWWAKLQAPKARARLQPYLIAQPTGPTAMMHPPSPVPPTRSPPPCPLPRPCPLPCPPPRLRSRGR